MPINHDGEVFAFLDVPFDYAVATRPGARYGGRAILAALHEFTTYCTDKRADLSGAWFADHGAVEVVHDLAQSYANIADAVAALPLDAHPIVLGGDHSISDPSIRGLLRRAPEREFGLIVFDAHLDSREPVPGHEHSGNWVRTVSDVLEHSRSVQLGINAPIYADTYMRDAAAAGIMVRTPYEIRRAGWVQTLREAVEHVTRGSAGVYVSVDIDCLDAANAPGTQAPNACGLMPHEVIDAVYEISATADVVALDITEVSPPLDDANRTAQVAAHIVQNHMAGVLARQRKRT